MECPQCKQGNVDGAAFCNNCGCQLRLRCATCNMVNPQGSKFCSQCGADLDVQAVMGSENPVVEPVQAPTTLACPRCHSVNEPGSLFCYNCGLPLDEDSHKYVDDAPGAFAVGRPAGFWIRLAATLIDAVLVTLVTAFLAAIIFGDNYFPGDWLDLILPIPYYTIALGALAATVGKLVLRIKVIRTDGSRVGYGRAFVRLFATALSMGVLLIGVLMIAFRRDKRGLHDLLCDTMVIIRH